MGDDGGLPGSAIFVYDYDNKFRCEHGTAHYPKAQGDIVLRACDCLPDAYKRKTSPGTTSPALIIRSRGASLPLYPEVFSNVYRCLGGSK